MSGPRTGRAPARSSRTWMDEIAAPPPPPASTPVLPSAPGLGRDRPSFMPDTSIPRPGYPRPRFQRAGAFCRTSARRITKPASGSAARRSGCTGAGTVPSPSRSPGLPRPAAPWSWRSAAATTGGACSRAEKLRGVLRGAPRGSRGVRLLPHPDHRCLPGAKRRLPLRPHPQVRYRSAGADPGAARRDREGVGPDGPPSLSLLFRELV